MNVRQINMSGNSAVPLKANYQGYFPVLKDTNTGADIHQFQKGFDHCFEFNKLKMSIYSSKCAVRVKVFFWPRFSVPTAIEKSTAGESKDAIFLTTVHDTGLPATYTFDTVVGNYHYRCIPVCGEKVSVTFERLDPASDPNNQTYLYSSCILTSDNCETVLDDVPPYGG